MSAEQQLKDAGLLAPDDRLDAVQQTDASELQRLTTDWQTVGLYLDAILPKDAEAASPLHSRGVHVTTSIGAVEACPLCGADTPGLEYHVELPEGPPGNRQPHPYWAALEGLLVGDEVTEGSLMARFVEGLRDRASRTTIFSSLLVHLIREHHFAGGSVPDGVTIAWLAALARYLPPSRGRRLLPIA